MKTASLIAIAALLGGGGIGRRYTLKGEKYPGQREAFRVGVSKYDGPRPIPRKMARELRRAERARADRIKPKGPTFEELNTKLDAMKGIEATGVTP